MLPILEYQIFQPRGKKENYYEGNSPIMQHPLVSEELDSLKQTVRRGGSRKPSPSCLISQCCCTESDLHAGQPCCVQWVAKHMPAPQPKLFQIVWIPLCWRQAFCVSHFNPPSVHNTIPITRFLLPPRESEKNVKPHVATAFRHQKRHPAPP